jgi:stage II sporulation protein D
LTKAIRFFYNPAGFRQLMYKPRPRPRDYFIGVFLALFFLVGRPVEFGQENSFFHGFLIKNPVIRIGLGVNLSEISIRSSSGMEVYEVNSGYRLLAGGVGGIHVKGQRENLSEKYILQVAQSTKKEEAERLAGELRPKVSQRVYVTAGRENLGEGLYQVRMGDFLTRGEALRFIKTLEKAGYKEAWILREEVTEEEAHALQVFVENELKILNKDTVIYFVPTNPQSYLAYNGVQYRGIFVLRATRKGLVLINILNLENYLLGVVPRELSPDTFNSFEALKAQAVAARTYAIKNMGQYRDLGFDLTDTPQSQVYGGLSAEHPLSSRAVEETKGEVATYRGKLINALYTSTCGGMTEDVENVFEGQSQPYLKSTECVYEKQKEYLVESRAFPPILVNGRNIDREVALLAGLRVVPYQADPAIYGKPVTLDEAKEWTRRTLACLGKKPAEFSPAQTTLNFPDLASLLIDAFQWKDRVDNLMLRSEVDFALRDLPGVKSEFRNSLAYLIHSGVFFSSPGLADEARAVTRGELAFALYKAMRSYYDPSHRGVFRSLSRRNELEVEEIGQTRILTLSPNVFLFRDHKGEVSAASRLTILGGEEIRWIEDRGEMTMLEASYPAESPILDRGSPFHRWQVRLAREELEKKINEYYPIGRLVDMEVEKRGPSHRATELAIVGIESQALVKGLKIRWVLGLRDTLFTLDREYGPDGQVEYFVFAGRGWGHGVGLCQVGAFRMGQAGADYREILKKYYKDVKISLHY